MISGDFNVYHRDYFPILDCGTGRAHGLCYNVFISNDLTLTVTFIIWISDCDSHSFALFGFFLFSDPKICPSVAFLPLGKSEHVVALVPIDFPYTQKRNVDSIVQLMTIIMQIGVILAIICEMLLGRIPLNLVLLQLLLNFVKEFRLKLIYICIA